MGFEALRGRIIKLVSRGQDLDQEWRNLVGIGGKASEEIFREVWNMWVQGANSGCRIVGQLLHSMSSNAYQVLTVLANPGRYYDNVY